MADFEKTMGKYSENVFHLQRPLMNGLGKNEENNHEAKNETSGIDKKVPDTKPTNKKKDGASEGRGTNLVRVSSWCERKQTKPVIEAKVSEKLPSVKELAKQFSTESTPTTIRRSIQPASNRRQLHDQVSEY